MNNPTTGYPTRIEFTVEQHGLDTILDQFHPDLITLDDLDKVSARFVDSLKALLVADYPHAEVNVRLVGVKDGNLVVDWLNADGTITVIEALPLGEEEDDAPVITAIVDRWVEAIESLERSNDVTIDPNKEASC